MIGRRLLTADDWREWRALRLRALATDPGAFGSTLADWTGPGDAEERWRRRFADVPVNLLLDLDGEPVGMVAAVPADDAVELISLWVVPAARGRGVGEAAIDAVVELAGDRPVVLSVRAANDPAIALYVRCGFVDDGADPDDPLERRMRRAPRP
ncbi:GNAT family N-acetyltransferase [Amnibacterium sp. CER49]|uniref:GNAT family N-acetyltransferase n=1 Tax=Amnibacterium sp. CER49 TaxID=3039161 RepID=UPI00244BB5F3|nr:GNAT family N-acetyltransferase [Amnibacterium sp. CER49]MDH2445078.1 GNAT family N-acetyltransferase [Amnibacterium sp. CER49]